MLTLTVSESALKTMLDVSRLIYQLKKNKRWLQALADQLPAAATIMPDQPSLLMGYDFHLTDDGPKLIEINNNAGGLFQHGRWLPQPEWSAWSGKIEQRLLAMFPPEWKTIAIVDDTIQEQSMYPEMKGYAQLLSEDGRQVFLLNPHELKTGDGGLYHRGVRIDAIYNRHTDFYLEHDTMSAIRTAFEAGEVALNPHPRSYALIGDKFRLADMWAADLLESVLDKTEVKQLRAVVPPCLRMADKTPEQWWQQRKQWVFKPAARHGGKGVMRGSDISRNRFAQLDFKGMVAQKMVPPSRVQIGETAFKTDFRLYMYGEQPTALAGRVWCGAVTNFRHPESGWAMINIEEK